MACLLTSGRTLDCKTQNGGIREVFFTNNWEVVKNSATFDGSGQLTDFDASTLYRYELKGTLNTCVENITTSEDGPLVYEQEVTIALSNIAPTYRKELMLMAINRRLLVFVRDNNDLIRMFGFEDGMEVSGGSIENGSAKGDFVGEKLTFKAMSKTPAIFVEPYTALPFDNIANATISPAYA